MMYHHCPVTSAFFPFFSCDRRTGGILAQGMAFFNFFEMLLAWQRIGAHFFPFSLFILDARSGSSVDGHMMFLMEGRATLERWRESERACAWQRRLHLAFLLRIAMSKSIVSIPLQSNMSFCINRNVSFKVLSLPASVRSQVFEKCLSKRSFSATSKASGHENPLVGCHPQEKIMNSNTQGKL